MPKESERAKWSKSLSRVLTESGVERSECANCREAQVCQLLTGPLELIVRADFLSELNSQLTRVSEYQEAKT